MSSGTGFVGITKDASGNIVSRSGYYDNLSHENKKYTVKSGEYDPITGKSSPEKTHGSIFGVFRTLFEKLFQFFQVIFSKLFGSKDKEQEKEIANTNAPKAKMPDSMALAPGSELARLGSIIELKDFDPSKGMKASDMANKLWTYQNNSDIYTKFKTLLEKNPDYVVKSYPIEIMRELAKNDKLSLSELEEKVKKHRDTEAQIAEKQFKLPQQMSAKDFIAYLKKDDGLYMNFLTLIQTDENVAKYFAQLEKEPDTMLEQGLTFEKLKDKANSMISDIEKGKSIRDIQADNTINNRVNFEKDKLVEPLKASGASEKAVETITSNNKAINDRMHHIEAMKQDLKEYSNLWFETKDKDKMMKDDMTLSKSLMILSYGKSTIDNMGVDYDRLRALVSKEMMNRDFFVDGEGENAKLINTFIDELTDQRYTSLHANGGGQGFNSFAEEALEDTFEDKIITARFASFLIGTNILNEFNFKKGFLGMKSIFDDMGDIEVKLRDGNRISLLEYGQNFSKYANPDYEFYRSKQDNIVAKNSAAEVMNAMANSKLEEIDKIKSNTTIDMVAQEKAKLDLDIKKGHVSVNTPLGRTLDHQRGEKNIEAMAKDVSSFYKKWESRDSRFLQDDKNLGELITILSYGKDKIEGFGLDYNQLMKAFSDEIDYRRLFSEDVMQNITLSNQFIKELEKERESAFSKKLDKVSTKMIEDVIEKIYENKEMSANTASFLIQSRLLNEDNFSSSNPFDQMNKIMVKPRLPYEDTISLLRYGKNSDKVFEDSQHYSSASNRRREEELTSNKENTTTTSKGIDKEALDRTKASMDNQPTTQSKGFDTANLKI